VKAAFLIILLMAGYAGQAQARECTEIGCQNGLILNVDPDYQWKWGRYEISFLFEGRSVNCQGYLPLKKCDKGPSFKCSSDKVVIGESGCALPESAHGISTIQINDMPGRMMVRIERDGKAVITRTLTPEYKESEPNGPGCEPVCNSATYNLLTAD
jgi:hypothetical protein